MTHVTLSGCGLLAAAWTSVALAGPDWDGDLQADAGSTISTAQPIVIGSNVNSVHGQLTGTAFALGGDFQDVYKFFIDTPGEFDIDLTEAGGGFLTFDACLWLFDSDGNALLGNNDAAPGDMAPHLTNSSNAGTRITITRTGFYFLAISGFASQPITGGEPLWPSVVFDPGVVAGGSGFWDGSWSGDGATGEYIMRLTGVSGTTVPAPGALALLAAAASFRGGRGRRRPSASA